MSVSEVKKLEDEYLVNTYDRLPLQLVSGEGAYVYSEEGKKYLDFLSGIGVNALGYSHPAITRVIAEQSAKLLHTSNLFFHSYQGELAKKLAQISGLDRVFFSNSGTEAWEGALKFARAYALAHAGSDKPKWRVLAMSNSFHGRTFGSLATTGQRKYRKPFAPLMPGVRFVRFNDLADLEKKFDDSVCAVALEVIQGEGGIQPVSAEFLEAARMLTKKKNALLLLDEIQSGLGKTGRHFAYQHYSAKPDVVAVAKPLAGGLPLGAIITTQSVAAVIKPGMHGTTFGGGPLACAVALEFLRTIESEKLLDRANEVGKYFKERLESIHKQNRHVVAVRGIGLMLALELDSAGVAKNAVEEMLARGVIINRTHDKVLRFLPPYIVTTQQVDEVIEKLTNVLSTPNTRRKAVGN